MTKESPDGVFTRRSIAFMVAASILAFGLPLVKLTTSIYRADLPHEEIFDSHANFFDKVSLVVPVYLDLPNSLDGFIPGAQKVLDDSLYQSYPQLKDTWLIQLNRIKPGVSSDDYVVKFEHVPEPENPEEPAPTESFYISPFSKTSTLYITDAVVSSKLVDDFLKNVLLQYVFPQEIASVAAIVSGEAKTDKDVAVPYSSKYNIVMSLLVENGKQVDWEIESAVKYLKPVFDMLRHFANFTVSTQVQYYSTLTNAPKFDENTNAFMIPEYDLSTFINHGEWNIINHDINPSINFIAYFAASNYETTPLLVENSKTNSFLIPQWGGVTMLNKDLPILADHKVKFTEQELLPVMETFASHLFELLGVPSTPKSPLIRIDSLSRVTALKNLKQSLDNLMSVVKLTDSLNEISVPELTKTYVLQTLESYNDAMISLQRQDFKSAVTHSASSLQSSNKAFFEKEMVQQAYFPSEHKLAVFLPLLGPVCSIVFLGLVKIIKDIKSEKRGAKEERTAESS